MLGGFDLSYPVAFGDMDYCLKARAKNLLVVWTPYAELYHFEAKTRGYDDSKEKQERLSKEIAIFRSRWKEIFDAGDSYYNPNLALDRGYFSLRPGKCDQRPRAMPGLGVSQLQK